MANVEDRVISASFESTKFQTGVSATLSSIDKLNAALKHIGAVNGLDGIEKSANKVHLTQPMSALDKLKAKFGMGIREADQAFSDVEKASGKVGFNPLSSAIDKIKGKFHFQEADQAFAQVERASGRVTFSGLSRALDGLTSQFGVMQAAAGVALGNIATKAAMAGGQMVKSLSTDPITGGLKEYETQLNAVQTILSNTKASGAGLKDVNAALQELNHYADKTIYNFTEMAKNIGTFTAAGVDLETATGSIKGIANLAALSGSNSQQASTAMYQLSQAISSGRVSLQDWNSVVNAGMGGTVFQRALAQTAEKMGTLDKGAVSLKGKMKNVSIEGKSFRESVMAKPGEESWLTSDVLTSTLKQLSGDMTDAELKAEGFTDAQIKAIQAQAKMAVAAATEVKTLTGVFDTAKEAMGSGWAQTWQLIFGDFEEAKKLFTGLSNVVNGFIGNQAKARNTMLKDWKDLGGRDDLIQGVKNVFDGLLSVIRPIKEAFRDIFPATTGRQLAELSESFRSFTDTLKIGPATAMNLKSAFRGLFALLDIGKMIVHGIFIGIREMLSGLGEGSGGVLDFAGSIGDLIVGFRNWLREGYRIENFFRNLGSLLGIPLQVLGKLGEALGGLFENRIDTKTGEMATSLGRMTDALKPAKGALEGAAGAWDGLLKVLDAVYQKLQPAVDAVVDVFATVGDRIGEAFASNDFDAIFSIIQTTLIGGIFLAVKKALGGGVNIDFGGGIFENITKSFATLQGSLVSIQKNIQAKTLFTIAAAVGVLTASIVALSLIDPKKLASSMTAISVGFAQMLAAMSIITKIGRGGGIAKIPVIAASLVMLAGAITVLSVAVFAFSRMSWEELARGLAGIGAALVVISAGMIPLQAAAPGMIRAGIGLTALGVGLSSVSLAVRAFGTMDIATMGKGLLGAAGALVVVGTAAALIPPSILYVGPGLIAMGIGLTAIGGAVAIFGKLDLKTIGKGILAMTLALTAIAAASWVMSPLLPLTGAGLILVGVGLTGIAGAMALMGSLDFSTIVKGTAGIALSLGVLAVGLTAMIAALPGAAALLVASSALAIFAPTLAILGNLSWATVGKGLAVIAASLIVIGGVGMVAAPGMIALGAALAVLGLGVLAVGAGVKLLADGISILAGKGVKGVAVFVAALTGMVAILPKVIINFLKGLVEIVAMIATLAPKVMESIVKITDTMLLAFIKLAPKFALAATAIITALVTTLARNAGPLIKSGWDLLMNLLKGISTNISRVTRTVVDIVTKFLGALASKAGQITAAGLNVLSKFLQGIANNLGKVVSSAASVVAKYISAIGSNIGKVITAGANLVIKLVSGIGNAAGRIVSAGVNAVAKLIQGIGQKGPALVSAGATAAGKFISSVARAMVKLSATAGQAIVYFLRGMRQNVDKYMPQITEEGVRLGAAIVAGIGKGLAGLAGKLADKLLGPLDEAVAGAKKLVKAKSPSRVFMDIGRFMMEGLAIGLDENSSKVLTSMNIVGNGVIDGIKTLFGIHSPSEVMRDLGKFVGQGFAEGLLGSQEDVNSAFEQLEEKLSDIMFTAQDTIKSERAKLKELREEKKKDWDAINDAKKILAENEKLLALSRAGHTELTKTLGAEKTKLSQLAKDYEDVATSLENAKTALEEAQKTRDDAVGSLMGKFSTLPEIIKTDAEGKPVDQLGTYMVSLQDQANAVAAYHETLQQLRALGLDDATYQKLLDEGTADAAFANQLLAGGKTAVDALNTLDSGLQSVSHTLAVNAANNLHQAGVDAAQGLVNGLESKRKELRTTMEKIAGDMLKALRKKLKIDSPSKEFAKIGDYSSTGLAEGIAGASRKVTDAAESVGDGALEAMRGSMKKMSGLMLENIETDPTITPVLDLTQIKGEAKKLADLTAVEPISVGVSTGLAAILNASEIGKRDDGDIPLDRVTKVLELNQFNTSPKALSEAEIYRQTNNQLSQAKAALGL